MAKKAAKQFSKESQPVDEKAASKDKVNPCVTAEKPVEPASADA